MPDKKKTIVEYFVYDDVNAFAQHAAEDFAAQIGAAATARGTARIAISGGNTPKPVFHLLMQDPLKAGHTVGQTAAVLGG